jgi:hypothetical protein
VRKSGPTRLGKCLKTNPSAQRSMIIFSEF